eukprot:TRINITY_DN7590_c0_g2_i1.p1 TRINITY_DN7590_c0_g2~~TRINITY_DN7590_c0_g2_i1.p1  ORF type:complete len:839 (+),score=152.15 TRINITY_DN7590_c0_g2_i1:177-2519(+)
MASSVDAYSSEETLSGCPRLRSQSPEVLGTQPCAAEASPQQSLRTSRSASFTEYDNSEQRAHEMPSSRAVAFTADYVIRRSDTSGDQASPGSSANDGICAVTDHDKDADTSAGPSLTRSPALVGSSTAQDISNICDKPIEPTNEYPSLVSSDGEGGDGEVSQRHLTVDLISKDLMEELSQGLDDWPEAPMPALAGFETPSEPGTPCYPTTPTREHDGGLMSVDQWDWKTDAPEFVPGRVTGLGSPMMSHNNVESQMVPPAGGYAEGTWMLPSGTTTRSDVVVGGFGTHTESIRLSQVRAHYEWQLRAKSEELREMANRINQIEIETAQVRASWEVEQRSMTRQIEHYRGMLERYYGHSDEASRQPVAQVVPEDVDRQQGQHLASCGQLTPTQCETNNVGGVGDCKLAEGKSAEDDELEAKMQQLSKLLQECYKPQPGMAVKAAPRMLAAFTDDGKGKEHAYATSAIETTLRAMFPHATIRTRPDDKSEHSSDQEVVVTKSADIDENLRQLEMFAQDKVDDRALRALHALNPHLASEVLRKVDELLHDQDGQCRNLSSMLQSVCRKMEKTEKEIDAEKSKVPSQKEKDHGSRSQRLRGDRSRYVSALDRATASGTDNRHGRWSRAQKDSVRKDRDETNRGLLDRSDQGRSAGVAARGGVACGHAAVSTGAGAAGRFSRARRVDEDGDAFDHSAGSSGERADAFSPQTNGSRKSSGDLAHIALSADDDNDGKWNIHGKERAATRRQARKAGQGKASGNGSWDPKQVSSGRESQKQQTTVSGC